MNAGYSQICISLLIKFEKITGQFWKIYVFSTEKDHFFGTNLFAHKSLPCKMISKPVICGIWLDWCSLYWRQQSLYSWSEIVHKTVCIAGLVKSSWQLHQRAVYWLDEDSPICLQWSQQPRWRFPRNSNCQGKILINIVKVKNSSNSLTLLAPSFKNCIFLQRQAILAL